MLDVISSAILPCVVILFVVSALFKRINIFNAFIEGASKGLNTMIKTAPALIALTFTVKLLRDSGVLDIITSLFSSVTTFFGVPAEIMPLALLRPISGSGSTALLSDIFEAFGPDSKIGVMASVLCCSSETTFYTVAVYYGSCNVTRTRHTIFAAVMADVSAVIFSILFVNLMFTF